MPSPPKRTKSWFASKTIWINAITAVIAENPQLAAGLVVAVSVANIALRVVTFLPLE